MLGPTGNLQGTYKFLSLATGKKVKRQAFTPYPLPDSVIKKVKAYGKSTALPGIVDFANRNGITQEWCSGDINPFHRSRRSSSLKGKPKTLQLAMPTYSHSTSQEW